MSGVAILNYHAGFAAILPLISSTNPQNKEDYVIVRNMQGNDNIGSPLWISFTTKYMYTSITLIVLLNHLTYWPGITSFEIFFS